MNVLVLYGDRKIAGPVIRYLDKIENVLTLTEKINPRVISYLEFDFVISYG